MSTLEAIVLGAVQGLTEFLPISSSAHLRIVPSFVGWEDPGAAFTAVIQLGTLAAVLVYFRNDILAILGGFFAGLRDASRRGTREFRLASYILVGTIPIIVFGVAFSDQIENGARSLRLMGSTLIVLGLVLLLAEKVGRRERSLESMSWRDGILVGIAQACALVPGVSRSGATISGGLFLGLTREAAARYSFLLSIPAVVLSGLYELRHVGEAGGAGAGATAVATVLAFVVGYASIAFLLRFLATHSTYVFVAYRVVLGIVVLSLVGAGTIH